MAEISLKSVERIFSLNDPLNNAVLVFGKKKKKKKDKKCCKSYKKKDGKMCKDCPKMEALKRKSSH